MSFIKRFVAAGLILLLAGTGIAWAQTTGSKTGLPLPRFVSLNRDKVYLRAGPSQRYPIRWVYNRLHLPVEVIGEYDNWRKVRDMDGDEGWVHKALLTGKRYVVIRGRDLVIRKTAQADAPATALFQDGVIAEVKSCDLKWCEVEAAGHKGHAERTYLWGLYADENLAD